MHTSRIANTLAILIFSCALLSLAACDLTTSLLETESSSKQSSEAITAVDTSNADIILINKMDKPVALVASELEASKLLDIAPTWDAATFREHKLPAKVQKGLTVGDIPSYQPGDDIRFFVYARAEDVGRKPEEGYAHHAKIITRTNTELIEQDFRVSINLK